MQSGLFKDAGVLCMLGVTAVEMREGLGVDRNGGEHTPCHVESLRVHVQGISPEAFYESFQRNRRKVVDAGLVKGGGVWIMDATDIEVDGEYAGMGVVREVIETVDKQGRHHTRVEEHKGFKWVTLCYLYPESKWLCVMAYRVLPLGEQHEITVSDELIE